MPDVFVDTAGWGHLLDPTQSHHSLATGLYRRGRQQGRKFVTTNYVILELVSLLTHPLRIPRPTLVALVASLKSSPNVQIVHVDPTLHEQAWELLRERQDKDWSLVDCSSFVVMRQRGIVEALTTDRHFEQAGFAYLLKPS